MSDYAELRMAELGDEAQRLRDHNSWLRDELTIRSQELRAMTAERDELRANVERVRKAVEALTDLPSANTHAERIGDAAYRDAQAFIRRVLDGGQ